MKELLEETRLCPYCHRPMQIADSLKDGETVLSIRYVCGCRGTIFHENVHIAQKKDSD